MEYFSYCLFVSNSQVTGCEDRLWNDLYCVGWGVKLCSIQSTPASWLHHITFEFHKWTLVDTV